LLPAQLLRKLLCTPAKALAHATKQRSPNHFPPSQLITSYNYCAFAVDVVSLMQIIPFSITISAARLLTCGALLRGVGKERRDD
jgi:hypothetical protein